MELILKNGLPHQEKGVQAVANVFSVNSFSKNKVYYANPTLDLDKETILRKFKKQMVFIPNIRL